MENLNEIIAYNLIELRKNNNLNQHQFAEKLNYSNKTISKWELGHAIPSVETLKEIADYYGVTVDYFFTKHDNSINKKKGKTTRYQIGLMCLVDLFFIIAGVVTYVAVISFLGENIWPAFVYAFAVCCLFNAIVSERWWWKTILPYLFASLCIWSLLIALYFSLLVASIDYNFWYLFFLGLPIQIAVILIFGLMHSSKRSNQ